MGVSLYNTNTEWTIITTKYGNVSCNVFFHYYDTGVRSCELLITMLMSCIHFSLPWSLTEYKIT